MVPHCDSSPRPQPWLLGLAEPIEERLPPERVRAQPSPPPPWVWPRAVAGLGRWVADAVLLLVGLRVGLELLGASGRAAFVAAARWLTAPLIAPFAGALPALTAGGVTVEGDDLLALACALALAWAAHRLHERSAAPRDPWN
ncbi:MAG TPA: hypothetical protein VMB50_01170 [Myxococcales bacterium]|nr:hypothetical protein [Myxococcales bacterium]